MDQKWFQILKWIQKATLTIQWDPVLTLNFQDFVRFFVENDLTDSVLTTPKYLQVQNVIVYLFVFQGELINLVKI